MTPYRGIIRIICGYKTGCLRGLKPALQGGKDVQANCIDCPEALTQVLDLDDKVVFGVEGKKLEVKGKRTKASDLKAKK